MKPSLWSAGVLGLNRADLERHLHQPPLPQDGELLRRRDQVGVVRLLLGAPPGASVAARLGVFLMGYV
jgi:hypothetical protein